MRGRWEKWGRIFCPDGDKPWSLSHAANPTVIALGDGSFRVLFSTRDADNRSHVRSADFSISDSGATLTGVSEEPVLAPGERGLFDDCGVTPGCVVPYPGSNELWMYYLGWNLATTVPWRNFIGLAVSRDGGDSFQKHSNVPVLDRNDYDPFSVSYPWVEVNSEGEWVMWYGTNLTWGETTDDMVHALRRAVSSDGICWTPDSNICLMPRLDSGETAISRPAVLERDGKKWMWASGKPVHYEMIMASSVDGGKKWSFEDGGAVVKPSGSGWDSSEVCYPYVFQNGDDLLMLYCGDGYGKTGFGLARWKDE